MVNDAYTVIGLMSGTSLDGLDIAICTFIKNKDTWSFSINQAITVEYSNEWKNRLAEAHKLSSIDLLHLHKLYGKYLGEKVLEFKKSFNATIDFIASHGQTIFHDPSSGLTFQLGDGVEISALTGIPVVSDFRSLDVALGGQGAPLVPVGDDLLFGNYAACLNLGGFANISFHKSGKRIAYDICPVNILINYFVNKYFNLEMDEDGKNAQKGTINKMLLAVLNNLEYYTISNPKSLGREWLENEMLPVINSFDDRPENILYTIYEHISIQLSDAFKEFKGKEVLITGGGAKNRFLLELLNDKTDKKIVIPDEMLIDYKEALIFAFLGVLRWRNEINTLASVTGAKRDSSGGSICFPSK